MKNRPSKRNSRFKQLSFSSKEFKESGPGRRPGTKAHLIFKMGAFGGAIQNRKHKRPFHAKKAVHVIFRSRLLSGTRSLLKANRKIWTEGLIKNKTQKHQVKLYNFSVNSNHIHMLLRFPTVEAQRSFLRDFSGSLALKIKKTFQISKSIRVWDERPFTKIVSAFKVIKNYIEKNKNEALGLWPYQKRPISYLSQVLTKLEARKRLSSFFTDEINIVPMLGTI
jgi:REP element-mobilizing transposase RayT